MTVAVPDELPVAFAQLARELTHENKQRFGRKGRAVTQRELQEQAIRSLLDKLALRKPLDLRGARHIGKRKTFWISEDLYQEMQQHAASRNIPVAYLFITACTQYLQAKGYMKE